MVGEAAREVFYEAQPVEAFDEVLRAIASIGKLLESSERTRTALGRTRYGLQRVSLRVSVVPADGGSLIKIGSAGDDIWGAAARKSADKLVRALG